MRLYFDEDSMSRALALAAQRAGFDVLTALDAGMEGRSDEEQLTFEVTSTASWSPRTGMISPA